MEKPGSTAGQAGESGLAARLKGIDGFDFDEALGMALDRIEFLAQMLNLFLRSHGEDAARLRHLLAAGDHAGIGTLAHGLKGAAATLGANRVAELASGVQAAARDPGEVPGHEVERLAQETDALMAALQDALESPRNP